jgi:hypothetical protein
VIGEIKTKKTLFFFNRNRVIRPNRKLLRNSAVCHHEHSPQK